MFQVANGAMIHPNLLLEFCYLLPKRFVSRGNYRTDFQVFIIKLKKV